MFSRNKLEAASVRRAVLYRATLGSMLLLGLVAAAALLLPLHPQGRAVADPPAAPAAGLGEPAALPAGDLDQLDAQTESVQAALEQPAATPVEYEDAAFFNEPIGACCLENGCVILLYSDCVAQGGFFAGANTTCADADSNGFADICEHDCNTNGTIDSVDVSSNGNSADIDQDGVPDECCPNRVIYTSMADFNQGYLFNLEHVNVMGDDCLKLKDEVRAWPIVSVANSGRGTLSRININNGNVIGEYHTAPDFMQDNPSRTTGDEFGNVWVTNRDEAGLVAGTPKGSVTRVGLVVGGTRGIKVGNTFVANPVGDYLQGPFSYCTCSDRDGDGLIKTSRGYPHVTGSTDYVPTVLPWPNTAFADSNGGVSTAEDECITAYVRVAGTGTRFLTIDAAGDVWTGGVYNSEFEKVDGPTATVVPLSQFNGVCGGYGGLIDKFNVLWSAGVMRRALPSGPVQCLGICSYGVALDPITNHVWFSCGQDVNEVSSAGTLLNTYNHGGAGSQGLVVDRQNTVWVAHSANSTVNTVGRLTTAGTLVGTVNLDFNPSSVNGRGPTGVAVDSNDKIWATNYSTDNAMRINRNLGVAGQVDLVVDLGAGSTPYNYSDMTGSVLLQAVAPQGNWTVIHNSGVVGNIWKLISWAAMQDPGTSVTVQVRASNNPLPSGPWTVVGNAVPFSGVVGQYLQVQVILKRPPKATAQVKFCELRLCSEPPQCLIVSNVSVKCSTTTPNAYSLCFNLTNNGAFPITHVFLSTDSPVQITPNHIVLGTPLAPTQTTTLAVPCPPGFTLTGVTPGQPFCLYLNAHDANFQGCCTLKYCLSTDLACGPGRCCRPCTLGGGCFNVTGSSQCAALGGTYFAGLSCTPFACPLCAIEWGGGVGVPVDIDFLGRVAYAVDPAERLIIDVVDPTEDDGIRANYGDSASLSLSWEDPESGGAVSTGARLRTRLYGTFGGVPDRLLGEFRVQKAATDFELRSDFYMVGSFDLVTRLEVYNGGMLVHSGVTDIGIVARSAAWPSGLSAGRSDPTYHQPYMSYQFAAPTLITIPGGIGVPPMDATEVRIIADNAAAPVSAVRSLAMTQQYGLPRMIYTVADRAVPLPCRGDCNGDAQLNGADIDAFVECLLGVGASDCGCADIDGTGTINGTDVSLFAADLLAGVGCP